MLRRAIVTRLFLLHFSQRTTFPSPVNCTYISSRRFTFESYQGFCLLRICRHHPHSINFATSPLTAPSLSIGSACINLRPDSSTGLEIFTSILLRKTITCNTCNLPVYLNSLAVLKFKLQKMLVRFNEKCL